MSRDYVRVFCWDSDPWNMKITFHHNTTELGVLLSFLNEFLEDEYEEQLEFYDKEDLDSLRECVEDLTEITVRVKEIPKDAKDANG